VEALARELREEVGLRSPSIGPHIWTREHHIRFLDGNWDGQREQIHLVRVDDEFEPTPELDWEQLRREYVHEIRWWSRDELSASAVRFVPLDLVTLIDDLVSDGPPPNAIDVRP
jgi:8-oxo-dGTP pyrophosphatase MutT (NUDIX family)